MVSWVLAVFFSSCLCLSLKQIQVAAKPIAVTPTCPANGIAQVPYSDPGTGLTGFLGFLPDGISFVLGKGFFGTPTTAGTETVDFTTDSGTLRCTMVVDATVSTKLLPGSSVIDEDKALKVSGETIANGDMAIQGQLQVAVNSNLTVQGSLLCNNSGSLVFYTPSIISVKGVASMVGSPALQLFVTQTPVLTQLTVTTYSFVVPVATFASLSGTFGTVRANLSFPRSNMRSAVVGDSSCYAVDSVVGNYGSTSLSVTVTLSDVCNSAGLSTGAIVGITVGAAIGGILIAVAIVFLVQYFTRRNTETMNRYITNTQMADMRQE